MRMYLHTYHTYILIISRDILIPYFYFPIHHVWNSILFCQMPLYSLFHTHSFDSFSQPFTISLGDWVSNTIRKLVMSFIYSQLVKHIYLFFFKLRFRYLGIGDNKMKKNAHVILFLRTQWTAKEWCDENRTNIRDFYVRDNDVGLHSSLYNILIKCTYMIQQTF